MNLEKNLIAEKEYLRLTSMNRNLKRASSSLVPFNRIPQIIKRTNINKGTIMSQNICSSTRFANNSHTDAKTHLTATA